VVQQQKPRAQARGFCLFALHILIIVTETNMSPATESKRLRIAMQKSGRLSVDSQALFTSCGLKINLREQRLIAHVENMDIDILRVRDDDIPGLVMDGVCDLGIVGENVLEEESLQRKLDNDSFDYTVLKRLDFGGCRLSIAVPQEENYAGAASLEGKTIATT